MLNRPTCKKGLGAHIILCKRLLSCYVCDYGNVSASCSSDSAHHYYRIFVPFANRPSEAQIETLLLPRPLEIPGSQRRYREESFRARGASWPLLFAFVCSRSRPGIRGEGCEERGRRGPPHSRKFFDVYGNEKEVKNRRISTRPSGARTRRTEREPEVIRKRGSRGGSMHFSRFISTGFSHPAGLGTARGPTG